MKRDSRIYRSAEAYLALRMHSVSELREKLKRKFPEEKEKIEETLIYFLEINVLNDCEFAQMFLQYRQSQKPKSTYVLRMELQKKGIDKEIIDSVIKENPIDDLANAHILATIKLQSFGKDLEPQKKKEKIVRYLQSRGFSYDVIREILNQLKSEEEGESYPLSA